MGAWIPGVIQGVQAKQASRDQKRANAELTRRMEASRQMYDARRPDVAAQRMTALRNQLGLFNPANQMMGEMTGGRYSMDLSQLQDSPLHMKKNVADLAAGDPYQRTIGEIPAVDQNAALQAAKASGYDVSDARSQLLQIQHADADRRAAANKPGTLGSSAAARIRGRK